MKTVLMTLASFLVLTGFGFGEVTAISVKRAAALLKKDPKIVVVDIRTPDEFAEGHIKGAININMNTKDFAKKLAKLDRNKTYLMHCRSGGRSAASIPVWNRLGFKNVLHLAAGTIGWKKEGQPLVKAAKKTKK